MRRHTLPGFLLIAIAFCAFLLSVYNLGHSAIPRLW